MSVIHNGMKKSKYPLSNASVDAVSAETEGFLKKMKYEPKNITSVRLSLEEYLLRWQSRFGADAEFVFAIGKRHGRICLLLELKGEQLNPIESDDEQTDWSNRILSNLGLCPTYSYSHGTNRVGLELAAHKSNAFFGILAAILLAAVLGALGRLALPPETINAISTEYLSLFSDKFFGLLRMVAGPIIFLSVVGGIGGIEDFSILGKFGKRVIEAFAFAPLLAAIVCGALLPAVFSVNLGGKSDGGNQLARVINMLLDFFPDNILNPFLTGNSIQIIVLAVAFGIAIMLFGKRTAELYRVTEELNLVVQKITKWIGSLIPVLVFTVILKNIWSDSGEALLTAWQPFLVYVVLCISGVVLYLVYAALRLRMNPITLMRKTAPSFMIGLTTASSSAAYGELNSCCTAKLGVSEKAVRFSIPFGMLICQIGCVFDLAVNSMYAIKVFDVEISLMTLAVSVIMITMLAIASPPVPGGLIACYAIVFSHFGIPDEAFAVAMTLNVFMDFVGTATNISLVPAAIAVSADALGMVDRDVLLSDAKK